MEAATQEMTALLQEARKDLQLLQQAAAAREAELARRVELINRENLKLPEKGLTLVRLQREVDLQQTLYSQLKAKYQEVLIQESGKVEEVSVVKPATEPAAPFNVPSKTMIVLTGVVMGLIIGVVLVFLTEVFDTSMGTIEDVEELLQVPVLGVIPQLEWEGKKKGRSERGDAGPNRARDLVTHYDPKSQAAESFRALRTNLQFLRLELKGKLFLITSSFVQEGKTLNAVNLALSMAQAGHRVLLVDADLRKPSVHRVFGLGREPGVTDYVLGNYDWQEVVGTISDVMLGDFSIEDILRTPGMDNLHVLTAGTKPPNPTEILSSERFRQFLDRGAADPTTTFSWTRRRSSRSPTPTEIAPQMDGVLLVYTVGRIGRGVLKRAKSNLDNVEAKVLGVVLNNVKPEAGPDYFRYHSHYYYGPDTAPATAVRSSAPEPPGRRWARPLAQAFGVLLVVLALSAFTLGVFWQEMPEIRAGVAVAVRPDAVQQLTGTVAPPRTGAPLRSVLPAIALAAVALLAGGLVASTTPGQGAGVRRGARSFSPRRSSRVDWGLYILIFSMLLSPEFMAGATAGGSLGRGVTLRLEDFLLVLIGLSWLARNAVMKDLGLFLKTPLNRPIFLYMVVCALSTTLGIMAGRVDPKTGFLYVLKYFEYFIVFFMLVNHVRDGRQLKRFVFCLFLTAFVVSLIGIAQIPDGGRLSAPFEGPGGEPNTFGGYLLFVGMVAAGLAAKVRERRTRHLLLLLIVCMLPPFFFTQSRSSYLAFVPALLVLGFMTERRLIIVGLLVGRAARQPPLPAAGGQGAHPLHLQPARGAGADHDRRPAPGHLHLGPAPKLAGCVARLPGPPLPGARGDRLRLRGRPVPARSDRNRHLWAGCVRLPARCRSFACCAAACGRPRTPFARGLIMGFTAGFVGLAGALDRHQHLHHRADHGTLLVLRRDRGGAARGRCAPSRSPPRRGSRGGRDTPRSCAAPALDLARAGLLKHSRCRR